MSKRLICLFLCLSMVMSLPLTALAQSGEDTLHIRSVEDFLSFAENCTLDSYSHNLTVYLHCDVDLTGTVFSGIPTFGGTFEGQNHRITGLELTGKGSAVGLFRYLQVSALVRDLSVSGRVTPGGSASIVGGIVGSNRGVLQNCSFEGSVSGKSNIGAIAGINEVEGYIRDCVSHGVVVGENMSGGIAGYNMGLIENCKNKACINIHTPDDSVDVSNIDLSILMDPASLSTGITVMDTGGIAGYSTGSIYDCVNTASIGYPHIGYNVGGIVGRSSGTISGCSNTAEIQGRKDVGGIVGQMEPHLSLNLSEDYLQLLEQQMGELEELAEQLRESFDQLGVVHDHLNNTLDYADGVSGSLEDLAGYIDDYATSVTDEFNRASLILDEILDEMVPVLEQATALGSSLSSAMDRMADALDAFAEAADYLGLSVSLLNRATTDMKKAGQSAAEAVELISSGIDSFANSLQVEDPQKLEQAAQQISTGLSQLADAVVQAGEAIGKIGDILEQEGTWNDDAAQAFQEILQSMDSMAEALQNLSEGATLLMESIHFSEEDFWEGVDSLEKGMEELAEVSESLTAAVDDLSLAMSVMEQAMDLGADAMRVVSDAMAEFSNSFRIITEMTEKIKTLVDRISRYEPIQLPYLAEEATEAVDLLFMNINGISDELRSIVQVSDAFSVEAAERFDMLTDQFSQVIDTAMKLVNQVRDEASNGLISDTSDVDIDAVMGGKVRDCVNSGPIYGDINVGGISGAMAIEFQLDPEDDISAELSDWQARTYQAKAIVQNCTNLGQITGKRNCMGGVCGKMDMGIILSSCNFGDVSSSDGSYVGGIVGDAGSIIRNCSVKANLSGATYVGGVAGLGVEVTDCYAMVWLTGTEKTGAILGYAQQVTPDVIARNYYFPMSGTPGAIDGISYEGCAQAAQGDGFSQMEELDERFPEAVLTFLYEDGSQESLRLPVGTVLEQSMIPVLENSDGQTLSWKDLQQYLGQKVYFDHVFTVERKAMTTVLESQQKREDGKSVVLLQGSFCTAAEVVLQSVADFPDALEGWYFELPVQGELTQIRYACPAGKKAEDLQIWVQGADGAYHAVSATRSGSYLVFAADAGITHFYVTESAQEGMSIVWLVAGGAAVAVGAAVLILVLRKKKKSAPRRRPALETEDKIQ